MILSEEIKNRLRRSGVVALYLFGSRANGKPRPESDFDFAVLLKQPKILKKMEEKQSLYFNLFDILTNAVSSQPAGQIPAGQIPANPVIDIIFLQGDASLELKSYVISQGLLLLDDDPTTRADIESYLMVRMADVRPFIATMDRGILERI